ncbi:unnamed protein product, partial [Allacma fusca]
NPLLGNPQALLLTMATKVVLFSLLLATVFVVQTSSQCCGLDAFAAFFNGGASTCDDGTTGTPCCGYGRCNLFCCDCNGGCRSSGRGKRQVGVTNNHLTNTLKSLDRNGDGGVD